VIRRLLRGVRRSFQNGSPYAGDGDDHRRLTLALRKANLARRVNGIFIAEYEQCDIGDVLFRVACNMGLEGIVSKRLDRAYGADRCAHWLKIKNPVHPAYSRVRVSCSTRNKMMQP